MVYPAVLYRKEALAVCPLLYCTVQYPWLCAPCCTVLYWTPGCVSRAVPCCKGSLAMCHLLYSTVQHHWLCATRCTVLYSTPGCVPSVELCCTGPRAVFPAELYCTEPLAVCSLMICTVLDPWLCALRLFCTVKDIWLCAPCCTVWYGTPSCVPPGFTALYRTLAVFPLLHCTLQDS